MTEASETPDVIEELFPPVDASATHVDASVDTVTLLEDRAQVRRRGRVSVGAGQTRVAIMNVAPVLRDVSLRVEVASGEASVVDARVRRAMRVRRAHKPADRAALEERIHALASELHDLGEDRASAREHAATLREMLLKTLEEIPEDAGWGHVDGQTWRETLEGLMERVRRLDDEAREARWAQLDKKEEAERLIAERQAMDRPDHHFVAWLEVDVAADSANDVELVVEYVVPNALWRPIHEARLQDEKVVFTSRAAVWQNTGEDWRDCQLLFSTARSSLGTEPPLLGEDRLRAQRRSEDVVVEARQVKIQKAGPERAKSSGAAPSGAVELPGVDDGGDIRTLRATSRVTCPSDGRPNLVSLFTFAADARTELVCVPELEQKVFLKASFDNGADAPILAGPVELIRDSGVVGWTRALFVAPLATLELGFGHDDALRVTRKDAFEEDTDPVDNWRVRVTQAHVFVSNLSGEERRVKVTERMPTSEIEHVKVTLLEDRCDPPPDVDDNGFATWEVVVPPNGRQRLKLAWRMATAPGVRAA